MVVPAMHHPHFIGHAGGIRAQGVVITLDVHDALSLLLFLADHVAEDAALFVLEPFMSGSQFVLDAPWHKDRRRHLRMRVGPLLPGKRAYKTTWSEAGLAPDVLAAKRLTVGIETGDVCARKTLRCKAKGSTVRCK